MTTFSKLHSRVRAGGAALLAGVVLCAAPMAQASPQSGCDNCGTVISTRTHDKPAESGTGLGAVGGAVVGGLLGNQVGGGTGRTVATVAGAVGGGYAGNKIEKNVRSTKVTEVQVKMSNGHTRTFTEQGNPRWHAGDKVRVNKNNALVTQQ